MKNLCFLGLILIFFSCQNSSQPAQLQLEAAPLKYARFFSVEKHQNFIILHIHKAYPSSPAYAYVLAHSRMNIPDSLKNMPFIQIPVQKWVVTSTTHLPALSALKAEKSLVAFPGTQYISSPVFRKMIDKKQLKEVGFNGQLNPEKILELKPDLLMLFNSGNDVRNDDFYAQNGIPVIYNADWLETNPLGRAEWIKVFGLLLDKEQQADSIFDQIEHKYMRVKQAVEAQANHPLVFQGGKFGDKFFAPGGDSYAAKLIHDAGGQYLWADDKNTGSLQLNYENVLMELPKVDIWLNPGMYNKKEELLHDLPVVKKLPVFQNDKIYTYNLKKGATGGLLYFEYSNLHPDWVLDDLYHIFYPEQDTCSFHFYQKLP